MRPETKKLVLTSLFAGFMIGVGCLVYLACENRIAGAVLFSAGLFFVLTFGGTLFTGICGLKTPWRKLLAVFLLNGAGIFLAGATAWSHSALPQTAAALVAKKLAMPPTSWLTNGFLCGVMMYLGVTGFKKAAHGALAVASVLYAVPVFIVAMFEHSIADMGYLFAALPALSAGQALQMGGVILVIALGNVLGSKAARACTGG